MEVVAEVETAAAAPVHAAEMVEALATAAAAAKVVEVVERGAIEVVGSLAAAAMDACRAMAATET